MTNRKAQAEQAGRACKPRLPETVGALWGAAEATVFFVVPDVWISFMALRSFSTGFRAALGTLIGAVAAGTGLAVFATQAPETAFALVGAVPGVTSEVFARASVLADQPQPVGMVMGSISGLPYRVFAVLLGPEMSIWAFVGTSVLARAPRFFATLLLTWLVARFLLAKASSRTVHGLLVAIWCAIYVVFFALIVF